MKTSDIKKKMEQLDGSLQISNVEGMEDAYRSDAEGNLNISDVIEVIQTTDPDFVETNLGSLPPDANNSKVAGSGAVMYTGMDHSAGTSGFGGASMPPSGVRRRAYINILEQPASKALRFRYECEGRSAGSIPGVNSTPENKTFPAIQVVGYKGRAVVVVSCVTKDPPYRPHPHNLVGKEGCKKGVCTVEMNNENMVCTFSNLGIQCVKKKDIEEALKVREDIRVDPYRTGFSHRNQPSSIDLNAVRLCFQVFLEGSERGKFNQPLTPVVSDPIYDKKAMSDLVICKLSDCSCSVAGGKEVILLCEKVAKEDIQIRFYEEKDGQLIWEGYGDFQPTHVHKQVAISFRTPRYKKLEVEAPVKVCIQLRRPSDGATSEPLPFEFIPLDSDPIVLKRKRQKFGEGSPQIIMRQLHDTSPIMRHGGHPSGGFPLGSSNVDSSFQMNPVKCEPVDAAPYMYGQGGLSPMYPVISSPSKMAEYPMKPQSSPSPSSLAPVSPMAQPNVMVPSPSFAMPMPQRTPPMGAPSAHSPNPYPVSLVVAGEQNVYSVPGPVSRRETSQPNVSAPHSFGQTAETGQPPSQMVASSNAMELDNQNYSLELSLGQLDSSDLAGMGLQFSETNMALFDANLSENLSSHLTLSEAENAQRSSQACGVQQQPVHQDRAGNTLSHQIQKEKRALMQIEKLEDQGGGAAEASVQENMTDSFTRLTTTTIQELCTLNSMYKGTSNGGVERN